MSECIFCNLPKNIEILKENKCALAFYDAFPVSKGHLLVIPKRHIADFFDLSGEEHDAIFSLVKECKEILQSKYNPDGFNVGVNVGEAAGQSVFHVHVHLIPRYAGDVKSPKGGVRGVIPAKQSY